MKKSTKIGIIILFASICFYFSCVHYVDQYEIAIVRNVFTGELHCDINGGFHLTTPWVRAAKIDTRPVRVCMTTAGRGFNCKLAQFEPSEFRQFVTTEGFYYYWWANRISFNLGYSEEYRGMKDLLRGYAYGTKRYGFIKVLQDFPEPQ